MHFTIPANSGRLPQFLLLGCALLSSLPCFAAVWRVTADPSAPEDRIGVIVGQTGPGDTVLVEPGLYYEHVPLPAHALTLLSTDGPEVTVIDGGRDFADREGSILYDRLRPTGAFTLRGFTVRNGSGAVHAIYGLGGGGIALFHRRWGDSPVEITDCMFRDNAAISGSDGSGGAIYLTGFGAHIADCVFQDNTAGYAGGSIYLHGSATLTRCQFTASRPSLLLGEVVRFDGSVALLNCSVRSTVPGAFRDCLSGYGDRLELIGNRFFDQGFPGGMIATFYPGPVCCFAPPVIIRENVFVGSDGPTDPYEFDIALDDGHVVIENNTFVNVDGYFSAGAGVVQITGNIFSGARVHSFALGGGVVECNDVWPDSGAIEFNCCGATVENNITADPRFCNEAASDFRIYEQSPCAAANAPPGCGQIGALGIGCSQTPVERLSWGKAKHLFR